jgi:hypothetical protein
LYSAAFDAEFFSIGAECVKIQETANASHGISSPPLIPGFAFIYLLMYVLLLMPLSIFGVLQLP